MGQSFKSHSLLREFFPELAKHCGGDVLQTKYDLCLCVGLGLGYIHWIGCGLGFIHMVLKTTTFPYEYEKTEGQNMFCYCLDIVFAEFYELINLSIMD